MGTHELTVLVVDDQPDNLVALKALLKEAFPAARALTATSGPQALELALAEDPVAILLDVVMPGMDGFEVCRKLKADERTREIPVVFVTALRTDRENRLKALEAGAEGFLSKPLDEVELTAQVRAMAKIKAANLQKREETKRLATLVAERTQELEQSRADALRLLADLRAENEARQRSEAAFRESETHFRTLADSGQALIWTSGVDKKCNYFNRPWLDFTGRTLEQELGDGWTEGVHPDDLERCVAVYTEAFDRRVRFSMDYRMRTRSGEYRWIQDDGTPRYDSQGEFLGYIGHCLDITERKRAEEEAKQSRQFLLALIENSGALIFVKKRDGVYELVNRKWEEATGKLREETIGKTDLELFPGPAGERFRANDLQVMNTGKAWELEETLDDPSGTRHFLSTKFPLRDTAGTVVGMCGMAAEITARKRAEQKLAQSEGRYRNLIMHSPDAVVVNEQDRITLANLASQRLFGAAREEELLGKSPYELFHPDYHETIRARIHRLRSLGEAVPPIEEKIVRLDGNTVDVEVVAAPFAMEGGNAIHVILRDITERKRAEAERERLTAAIEQVSDVVIVTAPDGSIQYVNPAFETVTGYSREEALGRNPRMLRSGKHDAEFYGELWRTISSGCTWRGRVVNKRKNGTLYTEETTISPVRDGAGRIVSYVAVKRDITAHLRLEEQLLVAQKMEAIGILAGGVAHDFNNMLSVILNSAAFAIDSLPEGSPLRDDLLEVRKAGERAATLTRQLLAFSRKQVLEPQVLDLNQVVANMETMLRRLIGEHIELEQALAPAPVRVKADPGQLEQVIMNLVVNARDAMPGGGKLTIETAAVELDQRSLVGHVAMTPGPHVLLAICDTGHGLDADARQHLFEPFFTTKPKGKGTGLGLSTAYGIIKQSGGDIEVYSESGQGTTFKVYLPLATAAVSPAGPSRAPERPAVGTETILVVEDEDAMRRVAARLLRERGYKTLTAANGAEALEVAERYQGEIHLLLTDVVMPQMSGRQLADQLRLVRPEVRVLFMSGYTDNAIVHHGVLDPGTRFIGKPFSGAELARKVRDALDWAIEPTPGQ